VRARINFWPGKGPAGIGRAHIFKEFEAAVAVCSGFRQGLGPTSCRGWETAKKRSLRICDSSGFAPGVYRFRVPLRTDRPERAESHPTKLPNLLDEILGTAGRNAAPSRHENPNRHQGWAAQMAAPARRCHIREGSGSRHDSSKPFKPVSGQRLSDQIRHEDLEMSGPRRAAGRCFLRGARAFFQWRTTATGVDGKVAIPL